jgi:hypothetical protein
MGLISLFMFLTGLAFAQELPKFLTKHSLDTVRYISMDGRSAYVRKGPGILGMVSSFRSIDFISESQTSDFLVKGSRAKRKLLVEVIPAVHGEYDFYKRHKIKVIDWGNSNPKDVGEGINAKLHLEDEWVSYYHPVEKTLTLHNLETQKKFTIQLLAKMNPFFRPEVEMVNSDTVLYSDINDQGYAALVSYNLLTQKSAIVYKAPQTATRIELCSASNYIAIGEFAYEGVSRGSKILYLKLSQGMNLTGYTSVYTSLDEDLGNMVCAQKGIFFIKTMGQDKKLTSKVTEVVLLTPETGKVEARTSLKHVTQLLEMDGRILIPDRGEYYVLEGRSNISDDVLRSVTPNKVEELPLEL